MSEFTSGYNDQFSVVNVNIATATTTALVAGVTGQITGVYKLVLVAAAAQTIQFQDGAGNLGGAITMATGVPLVLDLDGNPWIKTSAGNTLNLVTTTTGQLSGFVYYLQKSPTYQ